MTTATDQKLEELRSLQNRKQILTEAAADTDGEARKAFDNEIAKWDKLIQEGMIEIQESVPEYKLRGVIEDIAQAYVASVSSAYEEAGVEMKRLPTPMLENDGTVTVVGAPRVPGLTVEKRQRTSTKGRTLDLSGLSPSITHSFRGGEAIVGNLNSAEVNSLDGQPFSGKMSDLLDRLYTTEDGKGFFSHIVEQGATQSAFTIFTTKAGGILSDEVAIEEETKKPSKNGKSKSN